MKTKSLSINKQFRRLFSNPIDPTMTWETMESLYEYVKSPTSYVNQIVGCDGKAYIIALVNGEKSLIELGANGNNVDIPENILEILDGKSDKGHTHTISDIEGLIDEGGTISISGYHIGPNPPTEEAYGPTYTRLLWMDTSDRGIDTTLDSIIIDELKSIISTLNKELQNVKDELEYIKNNGTIIPPTNPPIDDVVNITLEDGDTLITEDGHNLIYEYTSSTPEYFMMTENGDLIITEDEHNIVSEDYKEYTTSGNILYENGDTLVTEDGNVIVLENYIDLLQAGNILTENGDTVITEDGKIMTLEEYYNYLMSEKCDNMTSENDYLLTLEK